MKLYNMAKRYWTVVKKQQLPQNHDQLVTFIDNTLELGGWDKDNLSLRHAVASFLMHIDMHTLTVSHQQVIKNIRRAIANQVSFGMIQELKNAEKAKHDTSTVQEITSDVV